MGSLVISFAKISGSRGSIVKLNYATWTEIAFMTAVIINCLSLYLHKKFKIYKKFGNNAAYVHGGIIVFFWLISLGLILGVDAWAYKEFLGYSPMVGSIIWLIAIYLFWQAYSMLGWKAMINMDHFIKRPVRSTGIYSKFKNPMYSAFTLGLLGAAFYFGNLEYLYLSIFSYVFLNLILSYVERKLSLSISVAKTKKPADNLGIK